jgi:hypothetical protein
MRGPVTDAFDESDHLEPREVELTTKQVEWLQQKADERDLSFDHMLRSVVAAQIRAQSGNEERPSAEGDGSPSDTAQVASEGVTVSRDAESDPRTGPAADDEAESADPSSIVDSLRSASERLQDLTEEDEAAEAPDPRDILQRLQARLEGEADADEGEDSSGGAVLVDDQSRSMFDMMEEE